ncbi:MAG: ATP-binding protein [Planctomycetota bacterium]
MQLATPPADPTRAERKLSVLLIEDEFVDAKIVERNLRTQAYGVFAVQRVDSLQAAEWEFSQRNYDAVLLDLSLPDGSGAKLVERCLATAPETPIVCLTGNIDEHVAIEATRLGAEDYLLKDDCSPRMLVNALKLATERARLRQDLRRAHEQENQLKDRFLSHVSHEMRTPLTAILQFVTILRDGLAGEVNDDQARYLDIVHRNSEQLKRMISTLMDATRCQHGKLRCMPTRTRLEQVIESAVTNLEGKAQGKGVALSWQAEAGLPDAIADAGRMEQVIVNLLENAIKFTPKGQAVRVHLGASPESDEALCITVEDEGCGVAEDQLNKVFDRLFQDDRRDISRQGLGLGLHICREILELHGGSIHAERRQPNGTRFVATVPAYQLARRVQRMHACLPQAHDDSNPQGIGAIVLTLRATASLARAKGLEHILQQAIDVVADSLDGPYDCVLPVRRFDRDNLAIVGLTLGSTADTTRIVQRLTRDLADQPEIRRSGASCELRSHWHPQSRASAGLDPASPNETGSDAAGAGAGTPAAIAQAIETFSQGETV